MFARVVLSLVLLVQVPTNRLSPGIIAGRVLSLEGTPVAGLRIAAIESSEAKEGHLLSSAPMMAVAQTDDDGRYRLENIPVGTYYVVADSLQAPSYYPGAGTLGAATVVSMTANATISAKDFTLVRSSGVLRTEFTPGPAGEAQYSGKIAAAWGEALPNVTVMLTGSGNTRFATVTGKSGTFEFARLPAGPYRVEVLSATGSGRGNGYEEISTSVTMRLGENLQQDIALRLVVGNPNFRFPLPTTPNRPDIYVAATQRPSAPGSPQRRRLPFQILDRDLERTAPPVYPEAAKSANLKGTVGLACVFGVDGRVISLRVNTPDVDPVLARAAVEAVIQWRFNRFVSSTEPVETTTELSLTFEAEK